MTSQQTFKKQQFKYSKQRYFSILGCYVKFNVGSRSHCKNSIFVPIVTVFVIQVQHGDGPLTERLQSINPSPRLFEFACEHQRGIRQTEKLTNIRCDVQIDCLIGEAEHGIVKLGSSQPMLPYHFNILSHSIQFYHHLELVAELNCVGDLSGL